MTSRRSWLLGLALGAAITVGSMQDAHAQVPRTFTYQGQLLDNNGLAVNGSHQIQLAFYSDANGATPITTWTGTTSVANGIFNLEVGEPGGLNPVLTFNQQYFVGVSIDGGAELSPRTRLHSAPYAINSNAVNGIEASTTPQAGKLYPLNAQGKIDPSVLPAAPNSLLTINNAVPDGNGNFTVAAGSGIAVSTVGSTVTISSTAGSGGIQRIETGPGLIGGGTPDANGSVFVGLAPNAIDATMIGNGVITGAKLSSLVAGLGLYQDILGNLNVGVDNQTVEITGDVINIKAGGIGTSQLADGSVTTPKIANGAVTAAKVDPTQVQLRVTGVAPAGSFIRSIDQNGSVGSATVLVNPTLTRTVTGNDLTLGINLANPNTWTGMQNFNAGATATSLAVTGPTTLTGTVTQSGGQVVVGGNIDANGGIDVVGTSTMTGPVTITGALTQSGGQNTFGGNVDANGGIDVVGATTLAGTVTQTGGGQVTLSGNLDANNGLDVVGATTTQGITNTGNVGTTTLSTTGAATVGTTLAVGGAITAPAGGHSLGTLGSDQTVLTIRGVAGAGNTELIVQGDANINGNTTLANTTVTTLTATNVNTTNLGGNGGPINLTSGVTAGTQTITGGTYSGYTLNNGTLALGSTLTNNGTIAGGNLTGSTLSTYTLNSGNIAVGQTLTNNGTISGGQVNGSTFNNYTLNTGSIAPGQTLTNNGVITGGTINGATLNTYVLNGGQIGAGQTLLNGGTISGGNITGATVTGGTINNTVIGNNTPQSGTFTTLASTGLATLNQLLVNTTSQFNGLSAFGQGPATNGNKVIINGIVTPTPIGSSADYELVVNGDAQVTGSLWVNNFTSNILSAPLIKFDKAEPFTPGGDMTFGAGNVIFDGAGLVGDVVEITNIPGGAFGMHITAQSGTSGMKITGQPGSLTGLDIDPVMTGINVDATALGINIINAPVSLRATGIIDSRGTIENSTGSVVINDALNQTGAGQVMFSGNVDANSGLDVIGATTLTGTVAQTGGQVTFDGNVDANNGLDVIGASTFAGTMNQTGGGQITLSGNVDANNGLDVVGNTTMSGNLNFLGAGNTISNNASTQVTIADGINQTGAAANNFSGSIAGAAAGNTLGNGANATQLTVNGVIGGANELIVNGDANITGTLTSGGISMAGDIDMNAFDINDLDDLQFSQAGSEISNIGGVVTVNDAFSQIGGQQVILSGNVDANGGLDVVGATTLNGAVTQTNGNVSMGTTAGNTTTLGNTTGASTLTGSTVGITGATTVTGTFTQGGAGNQVTLNGNVDATNGLDVTGLTTMNGGLTQNNGNVSLATTAGNTTTIGNATGAMNLTASLLTIAAPITQTGAGQITLSGNVDANNGLDVVGPTTMNGAVTQTNGNVSMGTSAGNTVTLGNGTGAVAITGSTISNTATSTITNTAGTTITNTGTTITNNGNTVINGTLTQNGAAQQVILNGNVDATNGLDVTGLTTMNGGLTQSNGNVSLATTAGNTTTIGNTTGAMSLTGSTVNVAGTTTINTGNDLNTSIGNVAGTNSTTTVSAGTAGNIVLNGVDADALPTQWLTLNGTNQVRTTAISGTADEGVYWNPLTGEYQLGVPTALVGAATANAFTTNRQVNLNNNSLAFTRNAGTETIMTLAGGAAGAVTIQGQSGNLALGNDNGVNTINGMTIADGSGMTPAADVFQITNTRPNMDGLQITANPGSGNATGINSTATGTVGQTATAGSFTANGAGISQGVVATANGSGPTNVGITSTVTGASSLNVGVDVNTNAPNAIGTRTNGNNVAGTVGSQIQNVSTGINVSALNPAGTATGYAVTFNAGTSDETGLSVSMNNATSGANGIAITGIGSATGASLAMSGTGGVGVAISNVGTGTGVEINSVQGGGNGVAANYNGSGTGNAVQATSSSTNSQSSAVRAQGLNGGAAAINITGGDLKSTAAGGTGSTVGTTSNKIADVRPIQPAEVGTATVTVFNALVKANSTVILTVQEDALGVNGYTFITTKAPGSFTVTTTATWDANDIINYMIVNPD